MSVARDQRILIIVELLICVQVLLIHLFLNIRHVSHTIECFLVGNLSSEIVSVHLHGLAFLVTFMLFMLHVETSSLLGTHCIILLLNMLHRQLRLSIDVDLRL